MLKVMLKHHGPRQPFWQRYTGRWFTVKDNLVFCLFYYHMQSLPVCLTDETFLIAVMIAVCSTRKYCIFIFNEPGKVPSLCHMTQIASRKSLCKIYWQSLAFILAIFVMR